VIIRKNVSPFQRIRRGGLVLLAIVAFSVVGFRYLGDYDWLQSLWMVVITISTVGYGERSSLSPPMLVLTITVIVFGMSAAAYTFGGLIQLLLEGELDQVLGKRRMDQEITKMNRHVLICGYGRMGRNLAAEFQSQGKPFLVIDKDPDALRNTDSTSSPEKVSLTSVTGDATEESVLESAGVSRASTLVSVLPSDAENVFITLTARNLNPNIQIIARADHASTEKKLLQAGADRVVLPTVVGARQMARLVTKPNTAELFDLVTHHDFDNIELDELEIVPRSPLVGMTLAETEAHLKHGLLILAVKSPNGDLQFNPSADHPMASGQILIAMGHAKDIQAYSKEHQLKIGVP